MISMVGVVFSLLYLMVIAGFFFFKERIKSFENKIYSYMIIVSMILCILDISTGALFFNNIDVKSILYNFLVRLVFLCYVLWDILMLFYVRLISYKNGNLSIKKWSIKNLIFLFCIISFIMLILPLDINVSGNSAYPSGISLIVLLVFTVILIISVIFILVKNLKNIINKKYLPLVLLLFLGIVVFVVQSITQELLMTSCISFITILMYFTIENPDVKMIEELELAKEQADKANQAKTEFLSSMSHEIRTPLNAIVGFSQNLYEEDIPSTAKEQVQDIITASNNLLELVNGILDISKIEANRLEIVNEEYSFKKIFDELVSLGHARMGDKSLIFKTNYDESIPKVLYGDKLRVKQVILNILTNSIKYTKKGFIEFKVNSIIKDDVCRLIISVEDSGVGIKKENIDKLFTKFQRFEDRNTTIEGTGLGLAITKKLVELMNGQIIVQSVYGQGSKFTIALDQRIIKNPTISVEENTPIVLTDETYNLAGKKVLVVDDNKLNLKVASKLLEKYNLTLELVSSGFDCVNKIIAGEKYDLILLDDMMPKMTGVETLGELKKLPGFSIPVVILTANAIAGMREKYLADGFDDYLAKPIEKAELNKVLKEFLMEEE